MYAMKKLSSSTNGAPLAVGNTSTTIHLCTSQNIDGVYDQMFVWAANTDSAPHQLTITLGSGTTIVGAYTIPPNSALMLVVPGLIGNNSSVLAMSADAASKIYVAGYIFNVGY